MVAADGLIPGASYYTRGSASKAGASACLAKPVDVAQVLELFKVPIAMGKKI